MTLMISTALVVLILAGVVGLVSLYIGARWLARRTRTVRQSGTAVRRAVATTGVGAGIVGASAVTAGLARPASPAAAAATMLQPAVAPAMGAPAAGLAAREAIPVDGDFASTDFASTGFATTDFARTCWPPTAPAPLSEVENFSRDTAATANNANRASVSA